ncbi:hypothetical protein QOZ80_4AG0299110 [Eleusine coracana subsp. coracana]|nr:hypothetical protein QOZ80_4AG0299110 [Eleusine coracana subsp. coracana]
MVAGAVLILLPALLLLSVSATNGTAAGGGIGVIYGTRATSLPAPADVAQFLARETIVDRVRLLDADPAVLRALAETAAGLAVDVTVPNADVPRLTSMAFARRWVRDNVAPYLHTNMSSRIVVGEEVTTEANRTLLLSLVPAMHNLHTALLLHHHHHSLQQTRTMMIKAVLRFLRATGAPFMVTAYPFYGLTNDTLDLALFRPLMNNNAAVVVDEGSGGLRYTNMLDAQLDAVHSAMTKLGFGDVDVVVAQTGWPSAGEDWELGVGADLAREYNTKAIRHLGSGVGTPLMPNRTFHISIFSLFDENLKPGPVSERNFGIFRADMTPVYDLAGILAAPPDETGIIQHQEPVLRFRTTTPPRQWCVPKPAADELMLQDNIDFACAQDGVDCAAIRPGGICYEPDTVQGHAAYAMNLYFQSKGRHAASDCDFGETGLVTTADPSYGSCKFT